MTKPINKLILLSVFLLGLSGLCHSQIVVKTSAPYNNVNYLVDGILLGEGIKVSNVAFSGFASQIGFFSKGKSFMGIDSGIVLSTGMVAEMMPPQATNPWLGSALSSGAQDNDLLNLSNLVKEAYNTPAISKMEDAAILEFDFLPSSDSVVFNYVFASEEYPAYINQAYNDVFGFFISGPGIDGKYSSPAGFPDSSINIAVIPGTQIPITVSSVNKDRNGEYFKSNGDENGSFNFNGYTTVLTATAKVTPCELYHIKLAIADGSRNNIDSGVFLEAKSFSTSGFNLEPSLSMIENSMVLESCAQSKVTIKRKNKLPYSEDVFVSMNSGSVADTNDITWVSPGPWVIPAGEDSVVFPFTVRNDGLTEGKERLILDFHLISGCSDILRSMSVNIDDAVGLSFANNVNGTVDFRCYEVDTVLDGIADGGYGQYSYQWWENGNLLPDMTSTLTVNKPVVQTTYDVQVFDACNLGPINRQFVINPPPAVSPMNIDIDSNRDTLVLPCRDKDTLLVPELIYSFSGLANLEWKTTSKIIGNDTMAVIRPDISEFYYLTAKDFCGTVASDSIFITFANLVPLDVSVSNDQMICPGDQLILQANATGGTQPLFYYWDNVAAATQSLSVSPDETTQYQVTVTDFCGIESRKSILISVSEIAADFSYEYDETDFGIIINNYSQGQNLDYKWELDKEDFSQEKNPFINIDDVENHELILTVTDVVSGCVDSVVKVLLPQMFTYIPNAFTPNGDGYNDVFKVSVVDPVYFELSIYDRWGGLVFRSTDPEQGWDGTTPSTGIIRAGTYSFFVSAGRSNEIRLEKFGVIRAEP